MIESRASQSSPPPVIRDARTGDLPAVIALDEGITNLAKPDYWNDLFQRYSARPDEQFFLVAEHGETVVGFITGEIRAWEFGAPPCGWVIVVGVATGTRLGGVGGRMLAGLCDRFRRAGVTRVRTLPARNNHLLLSFFRSQGMMAGPSIELEMNLETGAVAEPAK